MEMRKWMFFLHNFIEPNHYAIAECVNEMISAGVEFTFVCKRILSNPLATQFSGCKKVKLEELPVSEAFWREYDGVHVVYDGKPSLALCALAYTYDIPYVITFHGGYDTNEKIYHEDVREKTVWMCDHAATVTVVCMKDRQALLELGASGHNIIIVAPPINDSLIRQVASGTADRYGITVVGRLIPKKGIEYALRALCLMPGRYRLDIVGDGPLSGELKDLIGALGIRDRVTWHGQLPLEETLRIIGKNLIFWHPSVVAADGNADGIPQAVLYAMALRRFVAASDESHIGELITSGVNGYICRAKSPSSLAETTLSHIDGCGMLLERAGDSVRAFCLENQQTLYRNIYHIGGKL